MGINFGNNLILCMKIRVFLAMTFWTLNTFNEFLALLQKNYCLKIKKEKKTPLFGNVASNIMTFKSLNLVVRKTRPIIDLLLAVISACFTEL